MQRKPLRLVAMIFATMLCLTAEAQPQYAPNNPFMPGDVNEDKVIDIADVNGVINTMLGKSDLTDTQLRNADFNHDGMVDIADVNGVINLMLGKGYNHADPMSLVVETRDGSRDVFPLVDKPQLSFSGSELLVESTYATSYYSRNQLYQIYYIPYSRAYGLGKAQRAALNENPNQFAVYIYRNDNDFNAHLNIDVESIRFSPVGTDSAWYDNALVQEIWTPDTVYRTPIAAVDSITFEAPKPIYKEDVFHLRDYHVPYILDAEGLSLTLSREISVDSIPCVGQIVISDQIDERLPRGFSGRVLSVETTSDSYIYTCEAVALTDIFERLVLVGRSESYTPDEMQKIRKRTSSGDTDWDGVVPFELGKFSINIPSIEGFISNSSSDMTLATLSITPKFCFSYVADIRPFVHSHVKVLFENKSKVSNELHLKVSGESSLTDTKKVRVYMTKVPIPLVSGVLYGEVAVSGDLYLKGNIDLKASFIKNLYNGDEYEWSTSDFWSIKHKRYDKDPNKGEADNDDNQWQSEVTLSVNGSFGFGASLDLVLFAVSENTLEISNTTTVGPELSGSLQFSSEGLEDGTLYSALKNTNVSFTPLKLSDEVKFNICMREFTLGSFSKDYGKKQFKLFPDFEPLSLSTVSEYQNSHYNPLGLYTKVTNDVIPIIPLKLGVGRYDEEGTLIDACFASNFYQYEKEWDKRWLTYDMSSLPAGSTYSFHPLIRIWGLQPLQLKAMPESKFIVPGTMSLGADGLTLKKDQSANVVINGGWGDYTMTNSNQSVCTAELRNDGQTNYLRIIAKTAGTSTIAVKDVRTETTKVVQVTVTDVQVPNLTLSTDAVQVQVGEVERVDITSGSGQYDVTSSNTDVAKVALQGASPQQVVIKGYKAGTAVITVTDTQTGQTATISVTVTDEQVQNLTLSTDAVQVQVGEVERVDITSGSGQYEVTSSNTDVTKVALQGTLPQQVLIKGYKVGTAVITVTDTQTGQTATISVTVTDNDPEPQTQTFTVNGVSFKMVAVEGGTFTMGATAEQGSDANDREKPAHQVTLSGYSIGQTEVTQELWQAVMGSNPSYFQTSTNANYGDNLQRPVEFVIWNDCQTFITKLNQLTGKNFRLPTEAEWEYAARGGNRSQGYKYAGSDNIDDVAWYWDNIPSQSSGTVDYGTQTVATKSPNELGLYDMSGNVEEWCQDWYGGYGSDAQTNPTGPTSGGLRVLRGGSWHDSARRCRVSGRSNSAPAFTDCNLGLRLAL